MMRLLAIILAAMLGLAIVKPHPAYAVYTTTYESPSPGDGAVTTDRRSPNNPVATAAQYAMGAASITAGAIYGSAVANNGNPFGMMLDEWEFAYRLVLGWAIEMDYFEWSGGEGHP